MEAERFSIINWMKEAGCCVLVDEEDECLAEGVKLTLDDPIAIQQLCTFLNKQENKLNKYSDDLIEAKVKLNQYYLKLHEVLDWIDNRINENKELLKVDYNLEDEDNELIIRNDELKKLRRYLVTKII